MDQTPLSADVIPEDLLDRLKESGLLSAEEINRAVNAVASPAVDGRALAQSLVTVGGLTAYQVQAVCAGTSAELRIGNYDVLDRLGAGGMGAVFKARHSRMKRIVALKVLSRSLAQDVTFVQRFQREVETIARLTHPNIVMAFDADEDAEAGHFLVMEFVDGRDFASLVQEQGPFDAATAVNCTLQAARGLEYAHGQGIIHRDIKPANLLRDAHGVVKVTDLGLARLNSLAGPAGATTASGITQAGSILGTVDYMPPEQAYDSTSIDHRADIYSLGATLYFLLLGKPPYQGQSLMATLLKHREAPIPSLAEANKDVPAELDAVFRRMVAKAPADRYQTMTEVVGALEAVETTLGGRIAPPRPGPIRPPEPPGTGSSVGVAPTLATTSAALQPGSAPTIELKPIGIPHGHFLKVVLVEPSRAQSAIIRNYLQTQGVQHIVAVTSGRDALEAVRSERPDVILSALHLADMTGVQLAQQIHGGSKAPAPGFVLISSEAESSDAGTLSKCGRAVLLQKPFTSEMLGEALRVVSAVQPPPSSTANRGKPRVLIVDDSAAARKHVRGVLEGLGLSQFVEAGDGARGVAAVAQETFDLIVTDYNMPYMDGRGLVGYLKQNPATASIPIIMVTTEEDPAKLEAVRQLGVAAVCHKSFQPEVVRKIVEQLVRIS